MDVLRQSANWGIDVRSIGTSWHYRSLNGASISSIILAAKALTLLGMHAASPHSLLVKKVRWFNSHQELPCRKDHLHTQAGRLSGGEGSATQCDGVMQPSQWLSCSPYNHIPASLMENTGRQSGGTGASLRWEIWKQQQQLEQAKLKTFTEMKDFRQPVTIRSLPINQSHFRIYQLLPTWFRGNTTRVYAGNIFFPPEPLRMEIYSKIFQQLWSREYALPKWLLHR